MTRTALAILLGLALASAALAQQPLQAGGLKLQPAPQLPFRASAAGDAALLQNATLIVKSGKEARPVALGQGQQRNGALVFTTDASLEVSLALRAVGRCLVWDIACANTGQAPLWLEVGPELVLKRTMPLTVFDGWDDFENPKEAVISTKLEGNMPLTCVWNAQATVAVGLEPSQLVSYLRHEYQPSANGATLAAVTRLVVDPGKTETVRFVTLAAPGAWGKYEAFEAYYDSFPSWFVADPRVDPRISLGGAQYVTWPAGPWSPEIARRLFAGWDWCYAPFRRTGDIVGRAELWDYQPARPPDRTRSLPRDQYLKWRADRLADGVNRCDVMMMFYIPAQIWCEETLARQRYADSLTTDPKVKTYFDTPWVTGHDNELRVFPLETTFGRQSYADMAQVAQELPISGFAFDTAGDAARYFGPALPTLPHRAWDDQVGAYCAENIAIAKLMDYVHTLSKNGRPLAVVANPMATGTYSACFHTDSAMLERNPWKYTRTESDRLRWKMGHKTLVWWEGYELEDFIDEGSITGPQLTEVYRGLADFTILQSLRVGYIPVPSFTIGLAKLTRWLPAIVECVQTGWQPVPAARVPEPLWSSRYGRDLDTLIALGQETGQPVQAEATIENARLGQSAYLFSAYDGSEVTNRVIKGETVIPVTAPVRTPVLLRAQMAVTPATALREAKVSAQTGISGGTLTALLNGSGATTLRVRVPAGMNISTTVDGKATTCSPTGEIKLTLKPQTKLVVNFFSRLFNPNDGEILDFPFVKDGQPNCVIVLPEKATETQRHAAYRIQEYWHYWYARAVQPATEVLLPIVEGADQRRHQVHFVVNPDLSPQVATIRRDLVIMAPNDEALLQTTLALLRALDTKYWCVEPLRATLVNNRTGLAGKVIE
jgi:hypothetical protein